MKKLQLWVGLLALFCSGVMVGGLGTWTVAEHRVFESLTRERPPVPKFIIRRLDRELGLDSAQEKKIEAIVCRTHQELMALRDRSRPEREKILQDSMAAMKLELSPDQQKKLDALHERFKARRDRKADARKPGPGGQDPCD